MVRLHFVAGLLKGDNRKMKRIRYLFLFLLCILIAVPTSAASKKTVYVLTKAVITNSERDVYNYTETFEYTADGLIKKRTKNYSDETFVKSYKYNKTKNLTEYKYKTDRYTAVTKFKYKKGKVYKALVPNIDLLPDKTYGPDGTYETRKYKWKGENKVVVSYSRGSSTHEYDSLGRKYSEPYNNSRVLVYDSNGFCIKDYNGGLERNWTIKKAKGGRLLEADWVQYTYRGTFTAKYTYKKLKVNADLAEKIRLQQASLIIEGRQLETI